MGKKSLDKGKAGEREVARLIRGSFFRARRGQQFSGGGDSPDIVHNIPGIHIEVKRTERFNLYAALQQATEDAKGSAEVPVVFHRKSGKKWVAVVPAEHYLWLQWAAQ